MEENDVFTAASVRYDHGTPYIEMRARVLRSPDGTLPEGKVMVMKTPILPPGASEEEIRARTTTEILDDDHPGEPFHCEACRELGPGSEGWREYLSWSGGRSGRLGRNDPCRCGSGKEYKKCCLP